MDDTSICVRRFVKVLLRAGHATLAENGFVADDGKVQALLAPDEVLKLASQGVVACAEEICTPAAQARLWLKRHMSGMADNAVQHHQINNEPNASRRGLERDLLSRLAYASGESFLAPHHLEAGRRVARWGERAQLRQRVTMSYDPAQVGGRRHGGGGDIADMAAEARKSLARIYAELPRDCAETIIDVCVFEKGLQTIETERRWPRRSAKLVLRIGLDQLADRLGLAPSATGRNNGRIRAVMGKDFAPTRFE